MVRITVAEHVEPALSQALAELHERTATVAYAHISQPGCAARRGSFAAAQAGATSA